MSGQPTYNVVDDEEMSSQGSVNAPVAHPQSPTQAQGTAQTPLLPTFFPSSVLDSAPTQQSRVAGTSRATQSTVPVESTQVVAAPTEVVDAPTRAETKQAFEEVSSALKSVSSQHDAVRSEMQALSRGMEEMRVARAGELETTAQVKEGLQRTMSASSLLEARLGQAESEQAQTRSAAEEAKLASDRAVMQAQRLQEEQERTTQQVTDILSAQADETQKRVQSATSVALQTQSQVRTLSSLARTADLTAKIASEKVERGIEAMEKELEAQKMLSVQEAQASRSAQDILASKLKEAQQMIQTTVQTSQTYELQMQQFQQKMTKMEQLLIEQRIKGQKLEQELSSAQDRIGGAERRARGLEEENIKIKGELQSWNEWYGQEETSPEVPVSTPVSLVANTPAIPLMSDVPAHLSMESVAGGSTLSVSAALSGPSLMTSQPTTSPAVSYFGGMPGWFHLQSESMGPPQGRGRRVSFGSVFQDSNEGNGNGNNGDERREPGQQPQIVHGSGNSTFNIGIKPKDPPFFHGRVNEDVDTWIAKVGDFLYLTEANSRQQVAYAATLLLEAAADWWVALLKERYGRRPDDWAEFTVLLSKRFGSNTRVDRARAELRNIRQGQAETVRAYSTRFEALLGKLPTFDKEWAKTQFIWGLHQRTAELVTISSPGDLHTAINQAEKVEMARNFAASGQSGQKSGNMGRGRGGWQRGRGRFNAVQSQGTSQGQGQSGGGQIAVQSVQASNTNAAAISRNQCRRCGGWGHWSTECPSPYNAMQQRGQRGRSIRGRRGGRGRGRRGRGNGAPSNVNAALQVSDASVPGPSVQPGPGAAPVPSQQGN